MVYESDFYTTRRPYTRPTVTSYSVTRREVPWHLVPTVPRPSQVPPCYTAFGSKGLPTPRHYIVTDTPDRPRRAEEQYSYSYSQESSESRYDSANPYSVPTRSYSSSSERVSRSTGSGPGNYSYTTERSTRSSDLPGGYHSSYSSTTSGRLPHGTTYRHFSYRDDEDDFLDYPYARKIQPYHKNIPYVGHKRLVIVQPSAHGWRVKQSSLIGEIDRIYHKVRPCLSYQPKEDYLNSRSIMSFDDETRSIRAKTAEILKKIHTPVPRAQRPMPLPGEVVDEFLKLRHELSNVAMKLILYPTSVGNDRLYYSHTELPITERITSDNYIDRLISHNKSTYPVPVISHYDEPRQYSRLGQGHLACLTFAGGRPISRRRNLASVEDYIRDDINVLSHYNRFRQAAEKAPHKPDTGPSSFSSPLTAVRMEGSVFPTTKKYGSIPHMPPTKSPITGSWKSNAPRRTQSDKLTARTTSDDEATLERKKKRREQLEEEAMKEAEEEKRRGEELKRQEELAQQAAEERQAELERKAREEEQERILREEAERMEALKKEEEERKAREEEEARIAKEEEERKAKEAEAKRKAKEEAAKKAEEERKAREEEERRLREEEERKAREEEERRAKEEEERRLKEEEERRQKEEEERIAKEEEERRIREEEERKAEEERLAKEEEEKQKAEQEEAAGEEEVEEKPEEEEPAEKPEAEEVNAPEEDEGGDEPVVEEPLSPEEAPAKLPADDEEEEEAEEEEE